MNFKDIYEYTKDSGRAFGRENSLKVGDKVMIVDDALVQHSKSVPAHAGYSHEQFNWRDTLRVLAGKVGTVSRVFPSSQHTNVDFEEEDYTGTIGIDANMLKTVEEPNYEANEGFDDDDYEDDEPETAPCPTCNAPNQPMGKLGDKTHYRCRQCGMEYSNNVGESIEEGPAKIDSTIKKYKIQLKQTGGQTGWADSALSLIKKLKDQFGDDPESKAAIQDFDNWCHGK